MDYEVIDNFLDVETADKLEQIALAKNIPMFYNDTVSSRDDDPSSGQFYFTHNLYKDYRILSEVFGDFTAPVMEKIPSRALLRAVINYYPRTADTVEHGSHIDQKFDHTVLLYSVNTNNGFTRLGQKDSDKSVIVESVKNRLIKFDGRTIHNSATQTDVNLRCNVNFNIIE